MAGYKQPSKLNAVSGFLLLVLVAGSYSAIKFAPPYWRSYKVKEVLDQIANRCRGRFVPKDEQLDALEQGAEKKIRGFGIEDGALRVRIDIAAREVTVSAVYKEVVRHWFIARTTTVAFAPRIVRKRRGK